MRPVARLCLLLVSYAALVVWPAFGAHRRVLGIVNQTDRGHLDSQDAAVGANIYSCDSLDTSRGGDMRVRVGAGQLYLAAMSLAQLENAGSEIQVLAEGGTVAFSEPATGNISIRTPAGVIRAEGGSAAAGEVTYKSANEIIITAMRGNLTLDNGGELRAIPEGKSADVTIQDALSQGCRDEAAADQTQQGGPPRKIGFGFIVAPAVGIGMYLLWRDLAESQSKPGN